jgi:putative acetyltransferase
LLPAGTALRPAVDADAPALIALVDALYRDYPGCVLLVDAEEPELRRPGAAYAPAGAWWVAEQGGRLVASVALRPSARRAGWGELRKLYVDRRVQGQGLGGALLAFAEAEMVRRGWRDLHLWTDSRFDAAHRLYARKGWHRQPLTRLLDDASHTTELEFVKRAP